ncbi:MAG: hypothetical protein AAB802_00370, partial [Patescibacteria group bacterium]
MIRILKYVLGFAWLAMVMFFFYAHHGYYQMELPGFFGWWPLWVVPLTLYGLFLIYTWISDEKELRLKLTVPGILFVAILTLFYIGNVTFYKLKPLMFEGPTTVIHADGSVIIGASKEQMEGAPYVFDTGTTVADISNFYDQAPPEMKPYLIKANFWQIQIGLAWTFIKVFGVSLLFIFAAWVFGAAVHRWIRRKSTLHEDKPFEGGLLEMVLGLGLMSTILFLIGALGLFNLPVILGTFLILLGVFYKDLIARCKLLWSWKDELVLKPGNMAIPIFLFLWLMIGIDLFDNLSSQPRGWDGLNRYIVIARDIASSGGLVERGNVYGWELFLALGYLLDIKLSLFWSALPGYLTFALMWCFARRYSDSWATALALSTLIVAPMMAFHLSDENKVDVAHWLFGTAVILAFLRGIDWNEIKIKDKSWMWIAGLLAGYAFTFKLTGVLMMAALLVVFAFVEGGWIGFAAALLIALGVLSLQGGYNLGTEFTTSTKINETLFIFGVLGGAMLAGFGMLKKKISLKAMKELILIILLMALPILPWFTKNAIDTKSLELGNIIFGANDIPNIDFDLAGSACEATGFYEEYDRYIGYNNNLILRTIELPWHATMNDTGATGAYVDMGFAFLGFLLLALLLYKPSKHSRVVLIFGITYFLFWLFKANGVTWYGFPLFSFMVVLLAATYHQMGKDWFGRGILIFTLGIWILSAFDARLSNYGKVSLLLGHTTAVSYDQVRESIFPYSNELEATLAEYEGLLYKIGTPMGYFIPNFFQRTFDDQLLDNFNCIYTAQGNDFAAVRHKLLEEGFQYVLYDSYTNTVGLDPEGTLSKKVQLFEQFASEELIYTIYDD